MEYNKNSWGVYGFITSGVKLFTSHREILKSQTPVYAASFVPKSPYTHVFGCGNLHRASQCKLNFMSLNVIKQYREGWRGGIVGHVGCW